MQQNRVKPMVEGGILSAVAVLFALITAYIPVFGVLVNLIWPVPIILLGVRHGYKWSILATIASGLIIAAVLSPLTAVGIVAGMGLIGIALGYGIHNHYSPFKVVGLGVAASVVSKLMVLGISAVFLGINPLNMQMEAMQQGIEQGAALYRSFGISEEVIKNISEQAKAAFDLMKIVVPALLLLAAVTDTYINFAAARLVLRKLGQPVPGFPSFKYWDLPKYVLYIFFVSLLLMLAGRLPEFQVIGTVGTNLQIVVSIALLVQGLALISFFADKYSLSRVLRWLILFLIFTNAFFAQIVLFAGAFDLLFDYRKLRITPGK